MPDYDWMSVASMQVSEPVGQSSWYRSLLIQTDEAGLVPGSAARAASRWQGWRLGIQSNQINAELVLDSFLRRSCRG